MKKSFSKIILILFIFALIMLSGVFVACDDNAIVLEVESIDIDALPARTYFLVGAELDIDDTVFYITYENGVSKSITLKEIKNDVEITGFDNSKRALNQTVTITYRGKSASIIVDVVNESDILQMTFNPNNGSLVGASQVAIAGKPLSAYISEASVKPSYSGYYFAGWYTSSDQGVTLDRRIDFNSDTFTESTVLYAKWQVAVTFVVAEYTENNVYRITTTNTTYVDRGGDMSEEDFNIYVNNQLSFKDKAGYTRAYKSCDTSVEGFTRADVLALEDANYGDGYKNLLESKTVYCVYVPDLLKLYFDFNGATAAWGNNAVEDFLEEVYNGEILRYVEIPYGTRYILEDPRKYIDVGSLGYDFDFGGWYSSEDYKEENRINTTNVPGGYSSMDYQTDPITSTQVFYARWQWELLLYSGVTDALLTPIETLKFDENQEIYYDDLPDCPEELTLSTSPEPVLFSKNRYTSWWAMEKNFYTDNTNSRYEEYQYALSRNRGYGLADFIRDGTFGNAAEIYANYYRIPYYIEFNTYSSVEQTNSIIKNGDIKYYGDVLRNYDDANSDNSFAGWYIDKYLNNALVADQTTVSGIHYGKSEAYVTNGKGTIIINSTTYFVLTEDGISNIYSSSPGYLSAEEKVSKKVGEFGADGRFDILGTKYYTSENQIYVLDNDGDVIVSEETYSLKSDFDQTKAYEESSYAIMGLHAAYEVTVAFRLGEDYGSGRDAFNNNEANTISIRMEYVADGVYYANVDSIKPAVPDRDGYDGYWLDGNNEGAVDPGSYDAVTGLPIVIPDFTKINSLRYFAAHYITQQFDVNYVLNNQKDTADFASVYTKHQTMLDEVYTEKVTYNKKATFYKEDAIIDEGTIAEGIVEWEIEGWYIDPNYSTKFDFNTAVITEYTLYAKWVRVGTAGLVYEYISADNSYRVSGFDGAEFSTKYQDYGENPSLIRLVIPDYYQSAPVTQIAAKVFKGNTTVKEIFVSNMVVKIGEEAFKDATQLEILHAFNQDVELGSDVFNGTKWYADSRAAAVENGTGMIIFNGNQLYEYFGTAEHLSILESSDINIKIIGYGAFSSNDTLLTLQLSNQISAIRAYAFQDCSRLQSITFVASERYMTSQLVADGIGINAFMGLTSLSSITIEGDNYITVDSVLYRRENRQNVELLLYPTLKTDSILVLPKTLTAISQNAFKSVVALKVIVFDSLTAPTLAAGENAFASLPNLKYILVSDSATYKGDDYNYVWGSIYANATYTDMFKYNSIDINYVSNIPITSIPDKTEFVYGDEAEDYRATTSNAATFIGWFLDEALTNRWTGSLEDWWEKIGKILLDENISESTKWNGDLWAGQLTVYAKWEVVLNTGSENAGELTVLGGEKVTDERIVITVDGVKYYATYNKLTGDVTFDDVAPSGTFKVDVNAQTLTRIISDSSSVVDHSFGRIQLIVGGKSYYATYDGTKLTFTDSTPSGTWSIDIATKTITRTADGIVTKYVYQETPITFTIDKVTYYASYDNDGIVTFEGSAPIGIFTYDVDNNILTRRICEEQIYQFGQKVVTVDGKKSYITVLEKQYVVSTNRTEHFFTVQNSIVMFAGSAPDGAWTLDGTTLTRTMQGSQFEYTVQSGYIGFALNNHTYFAYVIGGEINETLGNIVFYGEKPQGIFNIDPQDQTLSYILNGETHIISSYTKGYNLLTIDNVVFEGNAPIGTWVFDKENGVLARLVGNSRTDYRYTDYTGGNTPISFVDKETVYYASFDNSGNLYYMNNDNIATGSYVVVADKAIIGTVATHQKGIVVKVDDTNYFATINGTSVTFTSSFSGNWTADITKKTISDGSTSYPYEEALLIGAKIATFDNGGNVMILGELGISKDYYYNIIEDQVINVIESQFGHFTLTLNEVVLSNNNRVGVWTIDGKQVTLTSENGVVSFEYIVEPLLVAADGTKVGNINVLQYLTTIIAREEYIEEGYTTAWFYKDGDNFTNEYVDLDNVQNGGIVSVANRINVYNVVYKYWDYTIGAYVTHHVTTAEHFSTLVRPENPTHADINGVELSFGGWYLDEVNRWQDNATISGDITLYAHWTVRVHTMYLLNGRDGEATKGSDILVLYDATMTRPIAQNKPGYEYNWYTKNGDEYEEFKFSETKITQNYVLYADYYKKVYNVTFVSAQGTTPDMQEIEYGEYASYVSITDGLKDYVFVGWYLDQNYTESYGFASTPVTSHITLYAYWVPEVTTSLLYEQVNVSGQITTYQVSGRNNQDSTVYIPEKVYDTVDVYKIYKTYQDGVFSNELTGSRYELGNRALTIIDSATTESNYWSTTVFYRGTGDNYQKLYSNSTLSTEVGRYEEVGKVATVTLSIKIGEVTADFVYYVDLNVSNPEVVKIEKSRITAIEQNGFSNNTKITHLIISQYITSIGSNAFEGMSNLSKFTVLSDGNIYYDVNGRQIVNCNGTFASIDGVLYALTPNVSKPYKDGIMVSIDRLIKVPAKYAGDTFTVQLLKFSVNGDSINVEGAGPSIDNYAFEYLTQLKTIKFEATTRPNIGLGIFREVKTDLMVFVSSVNGFAYSDGQVGTAWAEWLDYLYPNAVEVTYLNTLDNTTMFTEIFEVFSNAEDKQYSSQIVDENGRRWTFGGWTTSEDMVNLYDFSNRLERDITLYSRWVVSSTSGLGFEKLVINGEEAYSVSIGSTTAKNIIIPNFYMGLPVRRIASFKDSKIESIYIPATVTEILDTAFFNTSALKTIEVDKNNTSFVIVDGVLYSYDNEELVLYPAALTKGGEYTVANNTISIRRGAFYGTSLTKITIASTVERIGYAVFGNNPSLERVVFNGITPPTLTANPFVSTSKNLLILVPGITNNISIVEVYRAAWQNSTEESYLNNIFATTVYLFLKVENGSKWIVHASPSTEYATVVDRSKIVYPTATGKVFIGWYTTEYSGGREWDFVNDKLYEDTSLYARWNQATGVDVNGTPYLTYTPTGNKAKVTLNRNAIGWESLEKLVISSHYADGSGAEYEVDTIEADAFSNMPALTTVVLPSTIRYISEGAFSDCRKLSNINLPNQLLTLGDNNEDSIGVFKNCIMLESIVIPSTVSTISKELLMGCASLKSVIFNSNPTSIGKSVFSGCIALTSIDLGNRLELVGAEAFYNCQRLQFVTLPNTVKEIGRGAFKGCLKLESVTFAEGTVLTSLGEEVFASCQSLDNIVIPDGVATISSSLFYDNRSLTSIFIPKEITIIGISAFYQCTALREVIFEEGSVLDSINASAFAGCTSLTQIEFVNKGNMSFATNVFAGARNLTHVIIHSESLAAISYTSANDVFINGTSAILYVDSSLVQSYKASLPQEYVTRVKSYYSNITYMIDKDTYYRYWDNQLATSVPYILQNLTDNLVSDKNCLDAPVIYNSEAWGWNKTGFEFGGWGYYKYPTDTTLTLFDFATGIVPDTGLTLYAIWIIDGTDGLTYTLTYDGTIQVSRGNIGNATELVIANYYKYNNTYLPVTRIQSNLISGTKVTSVSIPETISSIADNAFVGCATLKKFTINSANAENQYFAVIDDVLYTEDKKTIISYPAAKGEEYGGVVFRIPYETERITQYTFDNVMYIQQFENAGSPFFKVQDYVLYSKDGSTLIAYPAMSGSPEFGLPDFVENIYENAFNLSPNSSLERLTVDAGNTNYFAKDGVLYRRLTDTTAELVRYPVKRSGNEAGKFVIDTTLVTQIASNAFRYVSELIAVEVDSVTPAQLGDNVFSDAQGQLYILVPKGEDNNVINSYKVSTNWVEFSNMILPITATITYKPNNGDATIVIEVNTLESYPLYEYDLLLPYATPSNWYYETAEGLVDVVLGSPSQLVYGDTVLEISWAVVDATPGLQYTPTTNGYIVSQGTVELTADNGIVIIPSLHEGQPVVTIGDFSNLTYLQTIVIPDTVKNIIDTAFDNCTRLTDVIMLGTEAPEVDRDVLTNWRNEVFKADGKGEHNRGAMYFFVRADAIKNMKADSNWVSTAFRTMTVTVRVTSVVDTIDDAGNPVETEVEVASYNIYRLHDYTGKNLYPDLSELTTPVREGYVFEGWYTGTGDGAEYAIGGTSCVIDVRGSNLENYVIRVYAKWTKATPEEGGSE